MNSLLELIEKHTNNRQILNPGLVDNAPIKINCPYCGSSRLKYHGCSCTLVGYFDYDGNHYWCHATCMACSKEIFYQHRLTEVRGFPETNVWFGNRNDLIEFGIHNCCSGKYLHKDCGGLLSEFNTQLDGITQTRTISWSYNQRLFRTFLKCDQCELYEEFE